MDHRNTGNQADERLRSQTIPEESLNSNPSRWFKKHYLTLINGILALYVFLALLAPILMKVGSTRAADFIYRIYQASCHQLAYRSFFLFGEQAVYPRELAAIEGLKTYEQVTGNDSEDNQAARAFRGNEQLGYKTALCQRDLAIYGSLLIFGVIFALTKRRLKPLPWYLVPVDLISACSDWFGWFLAVNQPDEIALSVGIADSGEHPLAARKFRQHVWVVHSLVRFANN